MRLGWLLIALLSLCTGVLVGAALPRAQAEYPCTVGRYQIAGTGTEIAYRLDVHTGEIVIVSPHGYVRSVSVTSED